METSHASRIAWQVCICIRGYEKCRRYARRLLRTATEPLQECSRNITTTVNHNYTFTHHESPLSVILYSKANHCLFNPPKR